MVHGQLDLRRCARSLCHPQRNPLTCPRMPNPASQVVRRQSSRPCHIYRWTTSGSAMFCWVPGPRSLVAGRATWQPYLRQGANLSHKSRTETTRSFAHHNSMCNSTASITPVRFCGAYSNQRSAQRHQQHTRTVTSHV